MWEWVGFNFFGVEKKKRKFQKNQLYFFFESLEKNDDISRGEKVTALGAVECERV